MEHKSEMTCPHCGHKMEIVVTTHGGGSGGESSFNSAGDARDRSSETYIPGTGGAEDKPPRD